MSFWTTSDNQNAAATTGQFEIGGGEPIPAKTSVLAAPDEAKWDSYGQAEYISIRWVVLQPAEYKNRKVFQKLRVTDPDSKKADKAKRMLAAIDANAGGLLAKANEIPDDASLTKALVNKPMVLKLEVWQSQDKSSSGNWVAAVSPRKQASQQAAPAPVVTQTHSIDDEVPF
jgi:hypothetical protein